MREIASLLAEVCPGAEIEVIAGAKVPVVKGVTTSGLHLDIVLINPNGVDVTRGVQEFIALDPRVAPLIVVLKHWAQGVAQPQP